MAQVALLPGPPLGLGDRVRVGASLDDLRHPRPESPANVRERRPPALVLHGVVKKRGDGHVLVRAVLEGEAGDAEEAGDVGDPAALACLRCVEACGEEKGSPEAPGEPGRHRWGSSRTARAYASTASRPRS